VVTAGWGRGGREARRSRGRAVSGVEAGIVTSWRGYLAAFPDSELGGCVAAGVGRRGEGHSVNAKLDRASLLTRGEIVVASGPAGAAVATHDQTGVRGRWGIERLVEGRSACDAALEN
jgi:hypothetical protein